MRKLKPSEKIMHPETGQVWFVIPQDSMKQEQASSAKEARELALNMVSRVGLVQVLAYKYVPYRGGHWVNTPKLRARFVLTNWGWERRK